MNEWGIKSSVLHECRNKAQERFKEIGVKPVYIALSGSHMYGFPSKDSDIDIRCSHIIDTKSMFHLSHPDPIIQWKDKIDEVEIEFESQEIQKTIGLAMSNNSNILEQIFAKNFLTSPPTEYERLKKFTKESISKIVFNPYHGLAEFNYKKFIESMNPTYRDKLVKKYLYVMRAYLVGTHALMTGEIEPCINKHINSIENNDDKTLIKELIEKKENAEYQITAIDHKRCREVVARLKARMEIAKMESKLPEKPTNYEAWDDFILNVRLRNM